MAVLEAREIGKEFPGVVALRNVSLALEPGEIHCIVGENGAGKSTLVKILIGFYAPNHGEVIIDGVSATNEPRGFEKISYVPQELNLFQELSVSENLFIPFEKSGFSRAFLTRGQLDQAARLYLKTFRIDADPNEKVKNLSVSDQQMLQIARAATNRDFKILILDEPTTSLTGEEGTRLFEILRELKSKGKSILFISHKLEEVFALGDSISVLRNGEKVGESRTSAATIPWVIQNMCGAELDFEENCQPQASTGEVIMEVQNLSGPGFTDVSFTLRQGEILGFAGLVGAGRSEIMQTLFGFRPRTNGKATLAGKPLVFNDTHHSVRNGFIYLSEERKLHGILPYLSLKHNIGITLFSKTVRAGFISAKIESELIDQIIRQYEIKAASSDQQIMYLSGGNQQKAIVGRAMFISPKVLVCDEPTKGIDIRTKNYIYHLMKSLAEKERLGIILVSSELEELLKCSNRIITMYAGKQSGEFKADPGTREAILRAMIARNQERDAKS
jgi:ABC-type sugar transport system ATPase subunit